MEDNSVNQQEIPKTFILILVHDAFFFEFNSKLLIYIYLY
jgi:hypothetical protein